MNGKKRFHDRRLSLRARGLCERCGEEPAQAGRHIGIKCAAIKRTKAILEKGTLPDSKKLARAERDRAILYEGVEAIERKLLRLKTE